MFIGDNFIKTGDHVVIRTTEIPSYPVVTTVDTTGYWVSDGSATIENDSGVYYGGVKYCLGFNIWTTNEYVSIGIVKDGVLTALASQRVEDFFTLTFEESSVVMPSILVAVQISYDEIYIGATVLFNGLAAYAGRTINIRGIIAAAGTPFTSHLATTSDTEKHELFFPGHQDANPPMSIDGFTDITVSYARYFESSGFSFVSSHTGVTALNSNSTISLLSKSTSDISNFVDGFDPLSNAHSVVSAQKGSIFYIFQMSKEKITTCVVTGGNSGIMIASPDFREETCQEQFNSVFQSKISVILPTKYKHSNYLKMFFPDGIHFRHNSFSSVEFMLTLENRMCSYTLRIDEDGNLEWENLDEEDGVVDLSYSSTYEIGACSDMNFSIQGPATMMNIAEYFDDESLMIARYMSTKVFAASGQASAVRTMAVYLPHVS